MNEENTNTNIEKENWKSYLTEFTRRNENRPARLELLGDEIGASEEANHLPFVMASYEEKGSDAGDALITLGKEDSGQVMHTVNQVSSITPQIVNEQDAALEIAGADNSKPILIFEKF